MGTRGRALISADGFLLCGVAAARHAGKTQVISLELCSVLKKNANSNKLINYSRPIFRRGMYSGKVLVVVCVFFC